MKKIKYIIIVCLIFVCNFAFANTNQDVMNFFNKYVNLSNEWTTEIVDLYSNKSVIKRTVLRKNPVSVVVPFEEHKKMLLTYNKHKKLMKNIKNNYKNAKIIQLNNKQYKITALRCPSTMKECFNSYMIVEKTNNDFKIIEEYSEVSSMYFLKFRSKK